VCRKPINELVLNNLEAVPEVPEDHHLDMLDWAAYLALRIVDQDSGNRTRAKRFRSVVRRPCAVRTDYGNEEIVRSDAVGVRQERMGLVGGTKDGRRVHGA
jgi:hypothetical protein